MLSDGAPCSASPSVSELVGAPGAGGLSSGGGGHGTYGLSACGGDESSGGEFSGGDAATAADAASRAAVPAPAPAPSCCVPASGDAGVATASAPPCCCACCAGAAPSGDDSAAADADAAGGGEGVAAAAPPDGGGDNAAAGCEPPVETGRRYKSEGAVMCALLHEAVNEARNDAAPGDAWDKEARAVAADDRDAAADGEEGKDTENPTSSARDCRSSRRAEGAAETEVTDE